VSSTKPLLKVCGLTTQEDVALCETLEVDLIGFIFHPASPRCITPEAAAGIASTRLLRVGVFVDHGAEEISRIMSLARLDLAQLHGEHSVETCLAVGPERVIKVFWPRRYATKSKLERALENFRKACSFLLLDAGSSGGGHGHPVDFTHVAGLVAPRPWLLAGGIGPRNIREAMLRCRPDGLDLNSSVEQSPGRKDEHKVRAAVALVRGQP
jgi:phosphoribosylanthranilate isomerase